MLELNSCYMDVYEWKIYLSIIISCFNHFVNNYHSSYLPSGGQITYDEVDFYDAWLFLNMDVD